MVDFVVMIDVTIVTDDFNVTDEYRSLCEAAPRAGAVVQFIGLVRDFYTENSEESIECLYLQHYPGMTEKLCQEIIDEAQLKYPFDAVRLIHRVGKIEANQQIVFVGVASAHRENAFNACQFIMDYLKTRATVWKKEIGERGERWVGLSDKDRETAHRWQDKKETP